MNHLKKRVRRGVALLSPTFEDIILDVGCASGYVVEAMLGEGISNVIGLDLEIKAIRRGMKKKHKLILICADAMYLPFRDETLDKVLCLDLLEHVKDDRIIARELSRVLKHDGIIVVSVPNDVFPFNFWDPSYLLWKLSASGSRVHRHYSKGGLGEMLEACNLDVQSHITSGFICYALLRWLNALSKRWGISTGILGKFLGELSDREFDKSYGRLGVERYAIAKKKC